MSQTIDPRMFLRGLFDAAVASVMPSQCVPPFLPTAPIGRLFVTGAGKAAASSAEAVEKYYGDKVDPRSLVITRYQHGLDLKRIRVIEAGHPMPDDRGLESAQEILRLAGTLTKDDMMLCLVSGGGSALLTLPAPGLDMKDLREVNRVLLTHGVPIGEMNTIRKHLSGISGGRLARAAGEASVVTLAISDVPGDDLSVIASGLTYPDATTFADARAIIERRKLVFPESIMRHLRDAAEETVKVDHPCFTHTKNTLVARPDTALAAAAHFARNLGVRIHMLSADIEGEASDVARQQAEFTQAILAADPSRKAPFVIMSGGETTVTMSGSNNGKGGRNTDYLLNLANALGGTEGIYALACDTDGIDGSQDNAGAIIDPTTLARAEAFGLDPNDFARRHDSYTFFAALGDLVATGPTLTNVNDFRAVYVPRLG